jgi:hypothetical protein
VKRLKTGIPALDTVLGGGLPVGSLIVVAGVPGTGKTILAQQICFSNGTPEHKAVYYSTISEPPEKFISHLEVFDFFDRRALVDRVEFINLGDMLQEDHGLDSIMNEIVRKSVPRFRARWPRAAGGHIPAGRPNRSHRHHPAFCRRIQFGRARVGARVLSCRWDPGIGL